MTIQLLNDKLQQTILCLEAEKGKRCHLKSQIIN